jgi:hypothetical protein
VMGELKLFVASVVCGDFRTGVIKHFPTIMWAEDRESARLDAWQAGLVKMGEEADIHVNVAEIPESIVPHNRLMLEEMTHIIPEREL